MRNHFAPEVFSQCLFLFIMILQFHGSFCVPEGEILPFSDATSVRLCLLKQPFSPTHLTVAQRRQQKHLIAQPPWSSVTHAPTPPCNAEYDSSGVLFIPEIFIHGE